MKWFTFVFSMALAMSTSAHAITRSGCATKQKDLEKLVRIEKDRFAVGEVDRVAVNKSELAVLDHRFECRKIDIDDYCQDGAKIAADILIGTQALERYSLATAADVIAAEMKANEITDICR